MEDDARELAQSALQRGVIVTPGTTLSVDGTHTEWLRLPFLLPPDQLRLGLERLIDAWEDVVELREGRRDMVKVRAMSEADRERNGNWS